MVAYDTGNIFARIIRGEIPAEKVYEDDEVLAVLASRPEREKEAAQRRFREAPWRGEPQEAGRWTWCMEDT